MKGAAHMWNYKDTPVIRDGDLVEIDFATGITTIDRKVPMGPMTIKSGTGGYTICGRPRERISVLTEDLADWLVRKFGRR